MKRIAIVVRQHRTHLGERRSVHQVEANVTCVAGGGAPGVRVFQRMVERAKTTRRVAENATAAALVDHVHMACNERHQFAHQIVGIFPDSSGVNVLITAKRGIAVG